MASNIIAETKSYSQKINLLKQRYKSTKDLWTYMTERLGYLMPALKQTRLQHIQDILSGRKLALKQKDVPARKVPGWPQLAVKNIYPQVIKLHPDLMKYLPDPQGKDERLPERDFFYKVVYSLHPEVVEDLVKQAAKIRVPPAQNLQEQAWKLGVKEEWMDQLLMYDYQSTKKGRGMSSLLITQVGQAKNKRRKTNDGVENDENLQIQQVLGGNTGRLFDPDLNIEENAPLFPGHFPPLIHQNENASLYKHPGTKKRNYPFQNNSGNINSGRKSDTDMYQYATPAEFVATPQLENNQDQINEEDEFSDCDQINQK